MQLPAAGLQALLAAPFLAWPARCGYVPPTKYLIVSDAVRGTIAYAQLDQDGKAGKLRPLVTTGLIHPQGIAVDQKRQLLIVADSESNKVVSYGVTVASDASLQVDEQTPLMENIEARWVAVHGGGNVFASDETKNQLLKVTARQVLDGDTTPAVVYETATGSTGQGSVSAPGGVAVDNFYVYWTNKLNAQQAGTVIKNLEMPKNETSGKSFVATNGTTFNQVLASNSPKAYGVCLALDNVFYTDTERAVYAVKKSGGNFVTVTGNLTSPRGCAWDGGSKVYVADRSQGAVFSLDGPLVDLTQVGSTTVTKVVDYSNAFGVAIFSAARGGGPAAAVLGGALALAAAGLSAA